MLELCGSSGVVSTSLKMFGQQIALSTPAEVEDANLAKTT